MKRNTLRILAAAGAICACASFALAEMPAKIQSKDISVSPKVDTDQLIAEFKPSKAAFLVNEPIQLSAKVNKTAYVYIINVGASGKRTVIFPNAIEKDNKLSAGKETIIPAKSNFLSDSVGAEHLVLIASVKPVALSQKKINAGKYLELEQDEFERAFKDIRVESRQSNTSQAQLFELDVPIIGQQEASVSAPAAVEQAKPVVMVGTDKLVYHRGDDVIVSYASDADGALELWTVNPNGDSQYLKDVTVEKNRMYKLKVTAAPPTGKQLVVAVYKNSSPEKAANNKNFDVKSFAKSLGSPANASVVKDLRLIEENPPEPESLAAYQFEIR